MDETLWNNILLLVSSCYEVFAVVAASVRYGYASVISYTKINKAVSQWLLIFNLCVSLTGTLTCEFHIPSKHTPEIIVMHRGELVWWLINTVHIPTKQI